MSRRLRLFDALTACAMGIALAARLAPAAPTPVPQVDAGWIVARVQARFDGMVDMRADVKQEVFLASLGRSESMVGTVLFKKPGRMTWDLRGEESQVIVADGEHLWFYQPADEQVLKAKLEAVFRSSTPVSFLMGVGRIADDFDATVKEATPEAFALELNPKHSNGDLGRLELVVERASFDVREAKVIDPVGNVTRLEFSNVERNTGIPDERFSFVVPAGVDVVEAPLGY